MKIQEVYARQVLEEEGLNLPIRIVHAENPITKIGNRTFNLIFPKRLLEGISEKTIEKIFIGKTQGREKFLAKFPNAYIKDSLRGRDINLKGKDEEYFNLMRKSKFALCPNGDFIWTYRFFEAILCRCIPIIEEECELYKGYYFYKLGDKYEYREDWIKENLSKIKKEMML